MRRGKLDSELSGFLNRTLTVWSDDASDMREDPDRKAEATPLDIREQEKAIEWLTELLRKEG